ncbi:MAG: hypothetical protein K2X69_15300 [Silvanigrellaceae bacterium]|nr:hypothetical protein [Silvanigrellaceae bacterium]
MQIPITNCTPEFLYKYRSLNDGLNLSRLKEIIVDKKLYFSGIDDFNDPFEFAHNLTFEAKNNDIKIEFIKQQIDNNYDSFGDLIECKSDEEMIKKFESTQPLDLVAQFNENNIRKKLGLGVLCLSSSCENINLWSHYADSNKGICIKFKLNENKANFFKVCYTSNPSISIYEQYYYEDIAKLKWNKFWDHEDEYRAINKKGPIDIRELGLKIDSLYLGINFYKNPFALKFITVIAPIIAEENINIFYTYKGKPGTYSIEFGETNICNIKTNITTYNKFKKKL